jgi:hypothetical protein
MKKIVIISLIILVLGCESGSGEDLTDQGRPLEEVIVVVNEEQDEEDDTDNGIKPTISSLQEHVFTPICSTCHGGANPAAGQNLSSIENTIANLINVNSSNPEFKRVLPGDALKSYLYLKVTGDSRAGSRMPLGQPSLPEEAINAIELWIDQGALAPQSSNIPAIVSRVTQEEGSRSMSMLHDNDRGGSQVSYQWQQEGSLVIVFWFNKQMNFDNLSIKQFLIEATNSNVLQKDNSWFLAEENIKLNIINDYSLQLNLTQLSSDLTHLNIQLNNSTISTLATRLGQQLDGDDNGTEGGVFNYELSL